MYVCMYVCMYVNTRINIRLLSHAKSSDSISVSTTCSHSSCAASFSVTFSAPFPAFLSVSLLAFLSTTFLESLSLTFAVSLSVSVFLSLCFSICFSLQKGPQKHTWATFASRKSPSSQQINPTFPQRISISCDTKKQRISQRRASEQGSHFRSRLSLCSRKSLSRSTLFANAANSTERHAILRFSLCICI